VFVLKYFLINIFLNISNYLIFAVLLFDFKKNNKTKKLLIFCIFVLISSTFLQNILYKKFTSIYNNKELQVNLTYDILIFGGNDKERIPIALNLIKNYKIDNVLYIKSNYGVKAIYFDLLNKKNLLVSEYSSSTVEDILIFEKYKDNLNRNIILVTNDFHVKRIKMIIDNKFSNKNLNHYSIIKQFDYRNDPFNFSRGLDVYSSILKEQIKIVNQLYNNLI